MKILKTREFEKDCRIAGSFNGSTLAIARAVAKEVLPGEKEHFHHSATEYYIFLRGKAEISVGDDSIEVSGGDVLVIDPGEIHRIIRIIEEIDYITVRDSIADDKRFIDEKSI